MCVTGVCGLILLMLANSDSTTARNCPGGPRRISSARVGDQPQPSLASARALCATPRGLRRATRADATATCLTPSNLPAVILRWTACSSTRIERISPAHKHARSCRLTRSVEERGAGRPQRLPVPQPVRPPARVSINEGRIEGAARRQRQRLPRPTLAE